MDGKNFTFDGRGFELFKKYVKWLLLTIITLSVYKLWLDKKLTMWKVSHTHFKGENAISYYKCGIGEKFLMIVKYCESKILPVKFLIKVAIVGE